LTGLPRSFLQEPYVSGSLARPCDERRIFHEVCR
jgi:hypothetical protein